MRFSSAARSRTASPRDEVRQVVGDLDIRHQRLVPARALSAGRRLAPAPRREQFFAQSQPRRICLGGIDDQRGQRGEMLGAALDGARPLPLALAEAGGGQQFSQRHDAGQRRADLMREDGERGSIVRGAAAWPASTSRASACALAALDLALHFAPPASPLLPFPAAGPWHGSPPQSSPTRRRISAGLAPCARNSRRPVAAVDFDSFLPSASWISRWWR